MASSRFSSYRKASYHEPPPQPKDEIESDDEDAMLDISWYHPSLSRHAAECMLIDNAPEGSYLLRPSSDKGSFVISVKLSKSVQHVKMTLLTGNKVRFGNTTFDSINAFKKHIEQEKPIIGGDSGVTVILSLPYSRFVDEEESHQYVDVLHHAVTQKAKDSDDDSSDEDTTHEVIPKNLAVCSREGYLTKVGKIRKSWKVRWFTLRNSTLTYYRTKQSTKPIDVINLDEAVAVEPDNTKAKENCFMIKFEHRTYYFIANSTEDCDQWVAQLRSRLKIKPH
ncbi:hypothetical protein EMCRGX_G025597 [Ephydatia muelleri]